MLSKISPALKISTIYLVFSLIWIFTSDNIVASMANDKETLNFLQTIKGWFFVSFTSLLILLLTHRYIKAEKLLNAQLKHKQEELNLMIESLPIPTFVLNEEGKVLLMNKAWITSSGYAFEEMNTLDKWLEKAYKSEASRIKKRVQKILNHEDKNDNHEFHIINKKGKELIWLFSSASLGTIDGKRTYIASALDITELKKQEHLIIQQSKMAALGEMIENIAHQWRQPLSTISALSSGVQLKNEMHDLDTEYIDSSMKTISENTQYLSNTIHDFRNFFDKEKIKRYLKIDNVIQKAVDLLKPRVINHNIEIVVLTKPIEFDGYENELIQVIINLLNNAVDALKDSTKERLIVMKTKVEESMLVISVQDSAGGVPNELLEKVFDPYFTTKSKEEGGTGIGLFMSKEIITKHFDGEIEVQNTIFTYNANTYEGANFIVRLPLHHSSVQIIS